MDKIERFWGQKRKDGEEGVMHKRLLEEKYNVATNPKADLLYKLAWDFGHALGFREVEFYYEEMVNLIK